MKQYIFSLYWMASTLSTASLIGNTTPKNQAELLFTICAMVITLTFYAYGMITMNQLYPARHSVSLALQALDHASLEPNDLVMHGANQVCEILLLMCSSGRDIKHCHGE
jgi:hypothetical protein